MVVEERIALSRLVRLVIGILFVFHGWEKGNAQIFPGLSGELLVEAIQEEFTPHQLLSDTQVKDTLYAKIFLEQDSVRCIYSGLARFLPVGVDPSQWLFLTGIEVGSLNLEHSWPQAKGAGDGTNGNMDMHHLFPSRSEINSFRANFPYSEINDNLTQKWFYMDDELSTKPLSNIDAYSEFRTGNFEPRETVKGDIARALFYFWTIYREDAMNADPLYFDLQREALCQWHEQDPVDPTEYERNERIAAYQEGKRNPFILDCSLVTRAYCNEWSECEIVATHGTTSDKFEILFFPELRQISIQGDNPEMWQLFVIDVMGHRMSYEKLFSNTLSEPLLLHSGLYIAYAISGQKLVVHKFYLPF